VWLVHLRAGEMLSLCQPGAAPRFVRAEPLGCLEFNYLVKHTLAVITDSGGITEDTTVMGIPCMTLMDSTKHPETVELGTNELIGADAGRLTAHFARLFAGQWKAGRVPPWDGHAAEQILDALEPIV
jgi:UDP-N-acetylglucosamine 2-epimerase (non-hydrolysing)